MEVAVILTSHGFFAQEALNSAQMIAGYKFENCGVVSVSEGKDYTTCLEELRELYNSLEIEAGVLILCDIYGGTPANISTYLAIEHPEIVVYTGFNLPILLEVLLTRKGKSIEEISRMIKEIYPISLTNINEVMKGDSENGNQVDTY